MSSKKKSEKKSAAQAAPTVRRRAAAKPAEPAANAAAGIATSVVPSPVATPPDAQATTAAPARASAMKARAGRLPPVGTVIIKKDRHGEERARCVVVDAGVEFEGVEYKSISAAAMASAKKLGLASKSLDGYVFWGLKKVARAGAPRDPTAALARAFERYLERAAATAKVEDAGRRTKLLEAIKGQARALLALAASP